MPKPARVAPAPHLASHALPPAAPTGPRRAAPGEAGHLPAGDPTGAWRKRGVWASAAMNPDAPDGPEALRGADALARLDLWFRAVEWLELCPDPETRAFCGEMRKAGEALAQGATDQDGRAPPLGRLLGIQPPAGQTAAHAIALRQRDRLLRQARAAVAAWRDLPPRQAARAMVASYARWATTAEARRETRPQGLPGACWWQLSRLALAVRMPGIDRLAEILGEG